MVATLDVNAGRILPEFGRNWQITEKLDCLLLLDVMLKMALRKQSFLCLNCHSKINIAPMSQLLLYLFCIQGSSITHPGIWWNGCRMKPIRGNRYKCHTCMDYDLCESCEKKGTHPEHNIFHLIREPKVKDLVFPSNYHELKHPNYVTSEKLVIQ